MWFIFRDFFAVLFYSCLLTAVIGVVGYILFYRASENGLSVKGILCYLTIVLFSFFLSFPFFGAMRLKSYVNRITSTSQEWLGVLTHMTQGTAEFSQTNWEESVASGFPELARFLPEVDSSALLEELSIDGQAVLTVQRVSDYYTGKIHRTLNIFIGKVLCIWLGVVLVAILIFGSDVRKENRAARERRMRLMNMD